jgi:colicin import membrane protein
MMSSMHSRILCLLIAALVPAVVAASAAPPAAADHAANAAAHPVPRFTNDPDLAARLSRLEQEYSAAITAAVMLQWRRPESVQSGQVCPVVITLLPGGYAVTARAADECAFDKVGRHSIEAAVLNAQPLPYRGYESVFRRTIRLTFKASES